MCKTKMNRVKEPIQISRTSRRTKSYETTRSTTKTSSSSSDPSSTSFAYTTTTSSSYKDSSKSSISSKTSLKSLRNSLPENAHIYDFSEIRSATKNFLSRRFSSSSSSSSSAWKCLIRGKDVIVFQRKFRRLIEMSQLQFSLSIICKSHHSSLIKLLGVSISGDYIYLVYEFVNGGNLRDCLRNPRNPDFTVLSSWISRMQIATDLAQGLEYIHYYTGLNLSPVHNHIKSTSVLVTEPSFKAKLCHFGTSELCGEIVIKQDHHTQNEDDRHNQNGEIQLVEENSTKKLRRSKSKNMKFSGTKGYMSPEYQITGIPTQKSDVYAFGVVILELLSGEEPLKLKIDEGGGDYKSISLIETAKEVIESNNKIRRWIDRRLNDSFPVEIAEKMTRVAIECVDFDPDKRPDMKQVACIFSKLYLQSKKWTDQMGNKIDLTVSLAPR